MIMSYLRSVQRHRAAARNYTILSALDDDALRDIGLERRTLRVFCNNGCTFPATPPALPVSVFVAPPPQMRDIRGLRPIRTTMDGGLTAAAR